MAVFDGGSERQEVFRIALDRTTINGKRKKERGKKKKSGLATRTDDVD